MFNPPRASSLLLYNYIKQNKKKQSGMFFFLYFFSNVDDDDASPLSHLPSNYFSFSALCNGDYFFYFLVPSIKRSHRLYVPEAANLPTFPFNKLLFIRSELLVKRSFLDAKGVNG